MSFDDAECNEQTISTYSVGSYVCNFYQQNIGNINISNPDHFYIVLGSIIKKDYPEGYNHIVNNLLGNGY